MKILTIEANDLGKKGPSTEVQKALDSMFAQAADQMDVHGRVPAIFIEATEATLAQVRSRATKYNKTLGVGSFKASAQEIDSPEYGKGIAVTFNVPVTEADIVAAAGVVPEAASAPEQLSL